MVVETQAKDRISELAVQKLAELDKQASEEEQKAKVEAEGAASGKSSTEIEKTTGSDEQGNKTKVEDGQEQVRPDEELMQATDEDLSDAEKARKQEIINEQEAAKTPEQKLAEWQEKTNKRFDDLTGELKATKAEKDDLLREIAALKGELEQKGAIDSTEAKQAKTEEEVYAQMLEEDKEKPRQERREMSEEELEDFLLEDYAKAQQWLVRRELRRDKEREARVASKKAAVTIDEKAEAFFKEFPECNKEARHSELLGSGKSEKEAIEIIMKESADFKLMMTLLNENEKYRDPQNGPELLAAEMRKRKEKTSGTEKRTYTESELEQAKKDAVDAEMRRRGSIDLGLSSTSAATADEGSPEYKEGLKLFIMAGKRKGQNWTEKDYKEIRKYRDNIR